MIHLTMTPIQVIVNLPHDPTIPESIQPYWAAIIVFVLVTKSLDWLRIYEDTAFYILLIKETIEDVLPFMILFVCSICMFAWPILMYDPSSPDRENEVNRIGYDPINAMLDQY